MKGKAQGARGQGAKQISPEDRQRIIDAWEKQVAKLEHLGYLLVQKIEDMRTTISEQREILEREKSRQKFAG